MACSPPHTPSCSEEGWDDKEVKDEAHLAGDGVEDVAMVKVPALVAQLVGASLHQADHVVPDNHQLRASEPDKKGT